MQLKSIPTALVACVAFSPFAAAVPLQSYETETLGSTAAGGGTIVNTGPGITDGNQAARSAFDDGNAYDKIGDFNLSALADSASVFTDFQVDVHVQDLDFVNVPGTFVQIVAGFFFGDPDDLVNFNQVDGTKESNPLVGDSYIGPSDNGQFTFTYSASQNSAVFAKINSEFSSGDFVGFGLYVNNDGSSANGSTFTVDNARFNEVPEPASVMLLAGGAALMALRRRRSAG